VGGTLVVGGVGAGIRCFGVAADNAVALRVVTGTGEELACSPRENPDLFDAVRAGLGQVGVITRATVGLVPAPRDVRRFLLSYPDLPTMLGDQRLLARDDRFDAVQGAVLAAPGGGWTFRLDATKGFSGSPPDDAALLAGLSDDRAQVQPSTLPHLDHLARLDALEQALRARGQWTFPHPWLTTFVGDSAVESVVERELSQLSAADLGPFGQVGLSAFPGRAVAAPLLRLPADGLCHAFNLIRFPASDSAVEAGRLVAANRAAYDRIRAAAGVLYPASALPMSPGDWCGHLGPAFAPLSTARARYDPGHVLAPGYEVFA
jgi:cytokinin dehydrogenase